METLLSIAIALCAGLLVSRFVKPLKLPAVTGYLIAGILIGPYCLGKLGVQGLGFPTNGDVKALSLFNDVADRRGEAAYAAWADDAAAYREKKLADFQNQSELENALMLLHDDDFACEITVSAGNALFDSEKLMTLMQNIAREHVFEADMFAKWSNSLFPLEELDEAAQSGQSYRVRIDRAAGKVEETVGGDVPEGVHIALMDRESGETLCEKQF